MVVVVVAAFIVIVTAVLLFTAAPDLSSVSETGRPDKGTHRTSSLLPLTVGCRQRRRRLQWIRTHKACTSSKMANGKRCWPISRTPTLWRWNRFDSCKCKCRPRGKHNAFGNKTHAPEQRTGSRRCQWPGRLNIIYAMKIRAIQMAIFHFIYITIFLYLFVSLSFLPPLTNLTPWLWMVSRCHAP